MNNGALNSYPNYFAGNVLVVITLALFALATFITIVVGLSLGLASIGSKKKNSSNAKKGHGFLKGLIIYLVIALLILYGAQAIDCLTNKSNKDGWLNPFSRTARADNVYISQSYEFNLSDNYTAQSYYDIKNLEITIYFLDNNGYEISRKTKILGDVQAKSKTKFAFGLNEFTAKEIFTIKKWRAEITGGTISYFSGLYTN